MNGLQDPAKTWFEPRHGQILVRPLKRRVTASGLAVPHNATELLPMVRVIAVSNGRTASNEVVPPTVAPGDLVTLRAVHTPLDIDGQVYALASEADVLGVVHNVDLACYTEGASRAEYDDACEAPQIAVASPSAIPRSNGRGQRMPRS